MSALATLLGDTLLTKAGEASTTDTLAGKEVRTHARALTLTRKKTLECTRTDHNIFSLCILGRPSASIFPRTGADWCPPCRSFTPQLAAQYKKLTTELGKPLERRVLA